MSKRSLKVVAGLAAVTLLAACSSTPSSTSSTSSTTGPKGTPILVGQIVPMTGPNIALPDIGNAVSASIDALNARGGINGHPVKLDQCDSQGSATMEIQCAQQMVSDHVVATIGDDIFSSAGEVNSLLHSAGIPRIGPFMVDVSDYANHDNFALDPGGIFIILAGLREMMKQGDRTFSILLPDEPSSSQLHLIMQPIASALGIKIANYVLVSSASGDYTQYVVQAQENGAQGAFLALGNAQIVQVTEAINQLHSKFAWSTGLEGFSMNQLKQLKPATSGFSYADWTPGIDDTKDFQGLKQVQQDFLKYTPGFSVQGTISQVVEPWLAVRAFSEIVGAQKTGPITATSVLADTLAAKDLNLDGIMKPWTPSAFISPGALGTIFSNTSNNLAYPIKFNGTGSTTSASQLFNVFVGLPGYSATGSTTATAGG